MDIENKIKKIISNTSVMSNFNKPITQLNLWYYMHVTQTENKALVAGGTGSSVCLLRL